MTTPSPLPAPKLPEAVRTLAYDAEELRVVRTHPLTFTEIRLSATIAVLEEAITEHQTHCPEWRETEVNL